MLHFVAAEGELERNDDGIAASRQPADVPVVGNSPPPRKVIWIVDPLMTRRCSVIPIVAVLTRSTMESTLVGCDG